MFQNIMLGYSMRSILNWLEEWHKENAFEDGYALNITIKALDNPGWMIDIDLNDTIYSSISMDEIRIDNADDDWMTCRIENNRFCGFGDCLKLEKILEVFKGAIDTAEIKEK